LLRKEEGRERGVAEGGTESDLRGFYTISKNTLETLSNSLKITPF